MRYIEFNFNNGEITGYYDVPEEIAEIMKQNGQHIIQSDTAFHDTHYVEIASLTVKERPEQNTVIDRTECNVNEIITLSGVPNPCSVKVEITGYSEKKNYEVSDGIFEWSTDFPATYLFTVEAFPFKEFKTEVNVIEGST